MDFSGRGRVYDKQPVRPGNTLTPPFTWKTTLKLIYSHPASPAPGLSRPMRQEVPQVLILFYAADLKLKRSLKTEDRRHPCSFSLFCSFIAALDGGKCYFDKKRRTFLT